MLCESYVAARLGLHDCTHKDGAGQEMSEVLGSCLLPGTLWLVMQQRCSAAGVSPARQGVLPNEPLQPKTWVQLPCCFAGQGDPVPCMLPGQHSICHWRGFSGVVKDHCLHKCEAGGFSVRGCVKIVSLPRYPGPR